MGRLSKPHLWLQAIQDRVEAAVHAKPQDVVLTPSVLWARTVTWTLIGTTGFGVAWLCLGHTEEVVVAPGKLEPIGSVKDVQMPLQGVTKQILVKDGDRVKKGQVLIELDTEATSDRRQTIMKTIALKRQELGLKEQELNRTRELDAEQIHVLTDSLVLMREVLDRYRQLSKSGATAELQYLEQRNKVKQVEGEIATTGLDSQRKQSILLQNIQSLKGELAELDSKLTEANVTLRYQAIKAPVDGVVFELKPKGAGFVAQSSEPVMKVVPFDKLKARVEIASKDIGFVSLGKEADVSIDSFPANDFGVLVGRVSKIGSDALPPDPSQNKQSYRFPADITLSSQQLRLKSGSSLPLQVGMSLTANIKLRRVSYLQLLMGAFRDKAESLRQI